LNGGVTQSNKADKRSQRQAVTAFYILNTHPFAPHNLPKPHYPLLCTTTLASLVKGRWIDGKAQALILLLSACDMPTIFMLQTFCRQDGGIAQQTLSPHNFPKPHYPTKKHYILS
jgi:hypothetical protein